jgi:hypothetical protein
LHHNLPEQDEAIIENVASQQWGGLPDLNANDGWTNMRELIGLLGASDAFQWR